MAGQLPCTVKLYMCKNAILTKHSNALVFAKYYQCNEILISAQSRAEPHSVCTLKRFCGHCNEVILLVHSPKEVIQDSAVPSGGRCYQIQL